MGRKKEKVRWTTVDDGFFPNEDEDVVQLVCKDTSSVNESMSNTVPNNCPHPTRSNIRTHRKPKHLMSQGRPEKKNSVLPSEAKENSQANSKNIEGQTVTGCGSADCNSCTCEMYCCCTSHENSAVCDEMAKDKTISKLACKNTKVDQVAEETSAVGNASECNQAPLIKDCDTNSNHSSVMNESLHSSCNNSNRSSKSSIMNRVESFSSSGTGSRDYDRQSSHGERRYERKFHYSREGNRRGYGNGDRGGAGGGWINAPLAPRFERKAAINAANAAANGTGYNGHQYIDHNAMYNNGYEDNCYSMDMEDLPNGFTKIRSKNLDVLFKKDYYAQRVHLNSTSSATEVTGAHSPSVSPNPAAATTAQTAVGVSSGSTSEIEATAVSQNDGLEEHKDACKQTDECSKVDACSLTDNSSKPKIRDINTVKDGVMLRDTSEAKTNIQCNVGSTADTGQVGINEMPDALEQNFKLININEVNADESNTITNKNENLTSLTESETSIQKTVEKENVSNESQNQHNTPDGHKNCSTPEDSNEDQIARSTKSLKSTDVPLDPRCEILSTSQLPAVESQAQSTGTSTASEGLAAQSISIPASSPYNQQAVPISPVSPSVVETTNSNRPNLFLYSPSSNTIIPCEEIIIPNHPNVMQRSMKAGNKDEEDLKNSENTDNQTRTIHEVSSDMNSLGIPTSLDDAERDKGQQLRSPSKNETYPAAKIDSASSKGPVSCTVVVAKAVTTGITSNGFTSPPTPGMNGNAPAFVPRQQQYFSPPLNIQHPATHLPHQPQTMIHYDQFGAPYTSYHPTNATLPTQPALPLTQNNASGEPGISSPQHPVLGRDYITTNVQYPPQSSLLSTVSTGSSMDMVPVPSPTASIAGINSCSETSSAESSATVQSPADLSVYSPANWVSSHAQVSQIANGGNQSRNGHLHLPQQMAINSVDGPVPVGGARPATIQHEFHRSMSSPAPYGSPLTQTPNMPGSAAAYGTEQSLNFTHRPQYPFQYNSHVYYHPSATAPHYINNQGGSNVWYNPQQQQYYSMGGTQTFVGPQYQNYVNGYNNNGGANLHFVCESSTMPSSAGDSMAEDDPRDKSEEEPDLHNQSRAHIKSRHPPQVQLAAKNNTKQNLSSISEQERISSEMHLGQNQDTINNTVAVMISTNTESNNPPSLRKEREGTHCGEERNRPFIPGLPAERLANKRVHKKRRKKKTAYNDGQMGEQIPCPKQSSAISTPDVNSGVSGVVQQNQKGKCISNVHRSSSSSEDLFIEGAILRPDNSLTKFTVANSSKLDSKDELVSDNINQNKQYLNVKKPQDSNNSEYKGCDEVSGIGANSSKIFLNEQEPKTVSSDSTTLKSFGCDNEKTPYPATDSLAEEAIEGVMHSLPTTSPSSPLQSINPSSSSIVISSSCLSSQEDEDNEKRDGKNKEKDQVRNENRRKGYDACLHKRSRNRNRSSSLSSNDEVKNGKNEMFDKEKDVSQATSADSLKNVLLTEHELVGFNITRERYKHDNNVEIERLQTKDSVGYRKEDIQNHMAKYSGPLRDYNSPHKDVSAKGRSGSCRSYRQTEKKKEVEGQANSVQGVIQPRNRSIQQGTPTRQRNKRINNSFKPSLRMNENGHNVEVRGSQQPPQNQLQRSFSSPQNTFAKGSTEDIHGGKKLYSSVVCKATMSNGDCASPPAFSNLSKSPVFSQPEKAKSRADKNSTIKTKYKLQQNKSSLNNLYVVEGISSNNANLDVLRRNSADDVEWEMATGTHGGSKTKRNRKGSRVAIINNVVQPQPNDSSSSELISGNLTENQTSSSHPRNKRYPGDVDQLPVSSNITPEMSETATTQKDDQNNTVIDMGDNCKIDSDKSFTSKAVLESEKAFAVSCANEKCEEVATEKDTICREEKSPSPPLSAPTSKPSTLRKQRKKRSTKDSGLPGKESGSNVTSSTIRPVLIQDGTLDIFGGPTGSCKRATEVLGETQIDEAVQKGHIDSLFISEIGYGMIGGPIAMGRFGIGKYTPPDRSSEILPMQKLLEQKQRDEEDAEAAAKSTVIKVLMGEVQVSSGTVSTGASSKSNNADVNPRERFEDVTDHDNTCGEEANKLLNLPPKSNLATKPVDLDLD